MEEGKVLWQPSPAQVEETNLVDYLDWLPERGPRPGSYDALWRWSVKDVGPFWETIFRYFNIITSTSYAAPIARADGIIGTRWFGGARLNYAEHIFRNSSGGDALVFANESGDLRRIGWNQLGMETASLAESLRRMGVRSGERVAGFLPNSPESVISLLACAAIGAIWTCCSLDFGAPSVIDRFRQVEPKVLIAADRSTYKGKVYDKVSGIRQIQSALPSVRNTILLSDAGGGPEAARLSNTLGWDEMLETRSKLDFERLPFEHPLWIVYSSGTTGLPKPLVHSHGGILLEHLKVLALHNDIKPNDRLFWFTTTGWMMWNYIVSGLLLGATVVLYDGSPVHPDANSLWTLAERTEVTLFGASAAYFGNCMKSGMKPRETHDVSSLRWLGSTGSPLSAEAFEWAYQNVKDDLLLASISGGTDLCTAFVGGCPVLPVTAGELQCRCLGAKVESYNEAGQATLGEMGELVITEPMPSMPVYLWNDDQDRRYFESYFQTFPGVWRHGDWIKITERGTCIIYGRSDATIKRQGVRLGTSEIYRYVEALPIVRDSLIVDLESPDGTPHLLMFVVLADDALLDAATLEKIRERIRRDVSPRFLPDEIIAITDVPRTLNGKKMEVPVKRILMGVPPEKALSIDSMSNPASVRWFLEYSARTKPWYAAVKP